METELTPYYTDEDGFLRFRYHPGQTRVMEKDERIVTTIAGTQSGKTVIGPWWLFREIKRRGPGDYLVAAPTFQLMKKKVLPEFKTLFERRLGLGFYHESDKIFTFNTKGQQAVHGGAGDEPTKVFFGHAQDPDSLESATAKAAWLDEAGQKKFKHGSWEAIQRRLSIHQGRILITTTPYYVGWLKHEVVDEAPESDEIATVHFDSVENPVFPEEEYKRQRQNLPGWKFRMMYRGRFERPAGMIYDCWDREEHCIPRFSIPDEWPRYLGLDFGGVNTAGIYLAKEPDTKRYILYRCYKAGGRTAKEHARAMKQGEPAMPKKAVGGSGSEDQWRHEFKKGGLPVQEPPVSEVEIGIQRVYSMLKATADERYDDPHLQVFADLGDVIDEFESYQRELDEQDKPTEKIDNKSEYHRLDALRYIGSEIVDPKSKKHAFQSVRDAN